MKQYITNEVLKKLSETINMNDTFLCMWNDDDRITTDDYIHFYLKN